MQEEVRDDSVNLTILLDLLLKATHSLSSVLAQIVARDLLCKDSLIIASSTPQISHFYIIARAYSIINLQVLPLFNIFILPTVMFLSLFSPFLLHYCMSSWLGWLRCASPASFPPSVAPSVPV